MGLQRRVSSAIDTLTYPPESLHISLLGCTQREMTKQNPLSARVQRIADVAERVVRAGEPQHAVLGGLNLIGTQFFVEVVPLDEGWAHMREALELAMRAIGEEPISFPNREPVHLNIGRLMGVTNVRAIADLIRDPENKLDCPVVFGVVEVVVTDFLLTPDALLLVRKIRLD